MKLRKKILIAAALAVLGVAGRFLPHAWNATPLAGIAIFSGLYLGRRYAIVLPLLVMLTSDLFLGFYEWPLMIGVYSCLALAGLLGFWARSRKDAKTVTAIAVASSTLFFLLTNWAVWQFTPWYEKTVQGLIQCYFLGLPFFRNALVGDMFYTLGLFALGEMLICRQTCNQNQVAAKEPILDRAA
jgi:hypothetical protein